MKVLVIGSGGREHSIIWSLSKRKDIEIFAYPGSAGISSIAECIDIFPEFSELIRFVEEEKIDFTIVGPEGPLALGIVDAFEKEGLKIIGPNKKAAQIESSKVFSKFFMKNHGIPTAEFAVFTSPHTAIKYIQSKKMPIVIKADGLAAGKGVFIAKSRDEAIDAIRLIMEKKVFGDAGNTIIIEEFLTGDEISYMVFTDGKSIIPMVSAQDYKTIFDNNQGPNTGGMGAYSPVPMFESLGYNKKVLDKIIQPVLDGFAEEKIKYKGILYVGLMIKDGEPYVLEFNCRFGDPEAQVILMRLKTDLLDILLATENGMLGELNIEFTEDPAVCVVLASKGYPDNYEKGKTITGLNSVIENDIMVFHSGTTKFKETFITSSGRVIGVTALGKTIDEARNKVYTSIKKINFDGMYYRNDIGLLT